jgi:hypothetical protein
VINHGAMEELAMKKIWILALTVMALATALVRTGQAKDTSLTPMPEVLETRYALSALPPALRNAATVYVLDAAKGYRVAYKGTSGVECLVERTAWEMGELRDDVYIPLCYDALGARTYLKVIRDAATLRARGMDGAALKAEIEKRFADGTYKVPEKGGVSYMIAPVMRTVGPPDMKQIQTMTMPHMMYYAPGITNADIGAKPDLADPTSLVYPLIDRQGNDEQSYIVQLMGETEKAKILADGQKLLHELCAHHDVLCLKNRKH